MKIVVDVVDFGEISVGPSQDNPESFRLTMTNDYDPPVFMDLNKAEMIEFVKAILLVTEHVDGGVYR